MTTITKIERYKSYGYTDQEIETHLELEIKLDLCARTSNALKRNGISTIKKLQEYYNENGDRGILALRNLGKVSRLEIITKCEEKGIELINVNICPRCGKRNPINE